MILGLSVASFGEAKDIRAKRKPELCSSGDEAMSSYRELSSATTDQCLEMTFEFQPKK